MQQKQEIVPPVTRSKLQQEVVVDETTGSPSSEVVVTGVLL